MTTDAKNVDGCPVTVGLPRPQHPFRGAPLAKHAEYVQDGDLLPVPWLSHDAIVTMNNWTDVDDEKVDAAITEQLCHVCGDRLENTAIRVLEVRDGTPYDWVGRDAGMHPTCAYLSFRKCPHLINQNPLAIPVEVPVGCVNLDDVPEVVPIAVSLNDLVRSARCPAEPSDNAAACELGSGPPDTVTS